MLILQKQIPPGKEYLPVRVLSVVIILQSDLKKDRGQGPELLAKRGPGIFNRMHHWDNAGFLK